MGDPAVKRVLAAPEAFPEDQYRCVAVLGPLQPYLDGPTIEGIWINNR